jgi:lysophospholipase L1-like esterase
VPSVAGKTVLLIGDSLTASPVGPGGVLARELRSAGAAVVDVNAKVGRSAYSFLKEGGEQQLAQLDRRPQIAIVMLGTNDTGYSTTTTATSMAKLKLLLDGLGAKVYAIGPPLFASTSSAHAGRQPVVAAMQQVFGAGFIDAGPATADLVANGRTPDQVHFTAAGGEIAGVRLARSFLSTSGGLLVSLLIGAGLLVVGYMLARHPLGERSL